MTPQIESNRGMPNAQEGVANIQFALKNEKIDPNFVRVNLDSLTNEINRVNGDLSRLGIKLDDLKHINQKLTGKADRFGADFPVQQAEALTKIIDQAESRAEQKPDTEPAIQTEGEPRTLISERSKILNLIDSAGASANTADDLNNISKAIDAFDDEFVVTTKQGSAERTAATAAYNLMDQRLRDRTKELNRIDTIRQNINL